MTIVFSHDVFFQRFGGVSRCMVELMRHLAGERVTWRALAGRYRSAFLADLQAEYPKHVEGIWSGQGPGRIMAALQGEPRFARRLHRTSDTVVHRTYYPVIDLLPRRVPVVVTLHDMYWESPGMSSSARHRAHSYLKRRALTRADRIVCISRYTFDELARTWPELASKAEVIHHGVSPLADLGGHLPAPENIFLYVGERVARKNFGAALAGLAASGLEHYRLHCLGGGSFTAAEHTLIARHGLTDRVTQRAADDRSLALAYASAAALLYTSIYEGFGMPLLEAMLHGCPVIAARASCLPEIAGSAALYAAPYEAQAWGLAMREVTLSERRADLVARGHERALAFSWSETARRHVEVYRTLCYAV